MDGDENLSIDVETIDDGTDNVIGTESRDLNCVDCGCDVGSHAIYILYIVMIMNTYIFFISIIYYILYIVMIMNTYILVQCI